MTWTNKLPKAPSKGQEIWDTNERLQLEWNNHVAKRGAKNTQRNHRVYVGVFLRSFDALATTLEREDIEAFVARIETKCAKLMNGSKPSCLAKQPISTCPLLTGADDYTICSRYQPVDPVGVWSYICSVNRFYEWLLEEGRLARNPALPVMRDYASRHSALFDERRRKPRRRVLKLEEVRTLVTQSPIHHGIAYMLMAKCFLRIHEVLKLSWDEDHCNLQERWMDIPTNNWDMGNKRLGNQRICLDAEALRWVRRYRNWWDDRVARDNAGQPVTSSFLITNFGRPWGEAAIHNLNTALHTRATELGLMTGMETERRHRINSHAFRAFATTYAKDRGIGTADLQTLRGDLSPGSIVRYDDYVSRLPRLWQDYGPVLDI